MSDETDLRLMIDAARQAYHWSGPKCSPDSCPGVDDCCYAEADGTGPDHVERWGATVDVAVLPFVRDEREKWMREGAEKAAQAIERTNAEINDAVGRSADWLTDAARLAREAVGDDE